MKDTTRDCAEDEEGEDECDDEIVKPTRPELKAALKLIQIDLLLSKKGKRSPLKAR